MPPLAPPLEPLPNNADNLYTSGTPKDINMEDGTQDSQGESLSSRATLDILLYRDTNVYMQEPPMLKEPLPVSEQLPIPLDRQEPISMSPGEVELWVHDDPCALPAMGSNLISAGHTRPFFPLSPDSPTAPVCRRIISEGRYKVPVPLQSNNDAPVQSTSHMPAPSRMS
jgi:hypothetical protein